jgi:hypothetical protein
MLSLIGLLEINNFVYDEKVGKCFMTLRYIVLLGSILRDVTVLQ